MLPELGAEAKGDELQQPAGDGGAQDEEFISLLTGLDGVQVLGARGFQLPIGRGAAGVARWFPGPEVENFYQSA